MKKGKILNKDLNEAIAMMGHSDIIIISDAGFPIPETGVKRVDLAITADCPDIMTILELVTDDFIYEKCYVAEEQKINNPLLFSKILKQIDRCQVETIPHSQIIEEYKMKAKVIVRTGAFEPWGNIILVSGVDAPLWFQKEGTKVPDYYADRAEYKRK
jgi:D-ribose pyranase